MTIYLISPVTRGGWRVTRYNTRDSTAAVAWDEVPSQAEAIEATLPLAERHAPSRIVVIDKSGEERIVAEFGTAI